MNENFDLSEARVWVGCLASYNAGKLIGKWFSLSDYEDQDDFYSAIQSYLKGLDKTDPLLGTPQREEWHFCDWEEIPEIFIHRYGISATFWEVCELLEDQSEEETNAFLLFIDHHGYKLDREDTTKLFSKYQSAYCGKYASEKDYAIEYFDMCYPNCPESIKAYIDYKAYAHDLFINECWSENGYVFQRLR